MQTAENYSPSQLDIRDVSLVQIPAMFDPTGTRLKRGKRVSQGCAVQKTQLTSCAGNLADFIYLEAPLNVGAPNQQISI